MRRLLAGMILVLGPRQDPPRPPVILEFAAIEPVATAGSEVSLQIRLAGGRPTHYRLGSRPDFASSPWQPYHERLRWRAARGGSDLGCPGHPGGVAVRLYLQVKAALGDRLEVVDGKRVIRPGAAESNVQSTAVCVVPAPEAPGPG